MNHRAPNNRGRTGQRLRRLSVIGVSAILATSIAACGTSDNAAPQPPEAPSITTSTSVASVPEPCPSTMGQCDPIAVVDLDGSGTPAAVSFHPTGTKFLTIVKSGEAPVFADVHSDAEMLTTSMPSADIASKIAFYNLDGRPGSEIVVPVGTRGANTVFEVFALRGGTLEAVTPPGETLDLALGMGFWTFPGERILARVMCREGGITLGSTEMPTPMRGTEIDFVSKPTGQALGEGGEWIVDGKSRSTDPSAITDLSIGQPHFKCEDLRIESLLDERTNVPVSTTAAPAPAACDENKDMTAVVASAIETLPAPSVWSWQKNADTSSLNPCAALSFATTTIDRATNSSPVAILLFHDGEFVGPASTCYVTIAAVEAAGENSVAVTYRYPELGDSNAGMTGRANYTFTWDNGKVNKVGTMPARLSELMDCTL